MFSMYKFKILKQIFPEHGKKIPQYGPKILYFSMAVLLIMWAKKSFTVCNCPSYLKTI